MLSSLTPVPRAALGAVGRYTGSLLRFDENEPSRRRDCSTHQLAKLLLR